MASRSGNVVRIAGTAFLVFVFLSQPLQASHPVAITDGPQFHSLGLEALDRQLYRNGVYTENRQSGSARVDHQMMVVLALLRAASLRPDERSELNARALGLWTRVQGAYDPVNQFYHPLYPAGDQVTCIRTETQAWGLRATQGLQQANLGNASLLARRVEENRNTILDLLDLKLHQNKPPCSTDRFHPISVVALLESRAGVGDARLDRIIQAVAADMVGRLDPTALKDPDLYIVTLNAQTFWMLTDVCRVFPTQAFIAGREKLAGFLLNESIDMTSSGPLARNVRRVGDGFQHDGEAGPEHQIWLAIALNHYDAVVPGRVPSGLIAGLMTGFFDRFWTAQESAFRGSTELAGPQANALAALASSSASLSSIATEASELAIWVPPRKLFNYESPQLAGSTTKPILTNDWDIRFQLSSDQAGPVDLLLTASDLASFQFNATDQGVKLFRIAGATRESVDNVRIIDGLTEVLRVGTDLSTTPASYRLEGETPVRPILAAFEGRIRLVLENQGEDPIPLRTLRLEISATNIKVDSIKLNQELFSSPEVISPVTTDEVREPHTRLILRDVTLGAGQSELVIEYTDIQRPEIRAHAISRDPQGRDIIQASPTGAAIQGEPLHVRAIVKDNAVLRAVLLRYQFGQEPFETEMTETDAGVYTFQIPRTNETGTFLWQVVAIDAASNLNQTEARYIAIQNPLLSGSRVLFAFSGTLFLSAFIIWFKVRRKVA